MYMYIFICISNCLTASPATVPGLSRKYDLDLKVWWPSWLQVGESGGHPGSKLEVWGPSWLQVGGPGAILAPSCGVLRLSWLQVGGLESADFQRPLTELMLCARPPFSERVRDSP